jgi:serine/threonine protein phosphatase PrpC
MAKRVIWSEGAAQSYLSLICPPARARTVVAELRRTKAVNMQRKICCVLGDSRCYLMMRSTLRLILSASIKASHSRRCSLSEAP